MQKAKGQHGELGEKAVGQMLAGASWALQLGTALLQQDGRSQKRRNAWDSRVTAGLKRRQQRYGGTSPLPTVAGCQRQKVSAGNWERRQVGECLLALPGVG